MQRFWVGLSLGLALVGTGLAQSTSPVPPSAQLPASAAEQRTLEGWLQRLTEAGRRHSFQGTLVVSSANGGWNSARITHICSGEQDYERVESLTGLPRLTLRHNDQLLTLWPQTRSARLERREALPQFPEVLKTGAHSIPEFYTLRSLGAERVAGFEAEVLQLSARDSLRYSYRLWSEKKTGLVLKQATLDRKGQVLELSAFSELQIDPPLKPESLRQQMAQAEGYRMERIELVKIDPAAEGWALRTSVPGWRSLHCFKRPSQSPRGATLQWVFTDGLATVSLFVETFDPQRHSQSAPMTFGATQVLTQPLTDASGAVWWLTLVGEAPLQTLQALAQGLERRR